MRRVCSRVWVLGALADLGIGVSYQPLKRHHLTGGQDRWRRPEAARLECRVAPRDDDVRHRRGEDARRAAYRPGEAVGQGHDERTEGGDPLRSQTGLARNAIIVRLTTTFRERYELTDGLLEPEELRARRGAGRHQVRHSRVDCAGPLISQSTKGLALFPHGATIRPTEALYCDVHTLQSLRAFRCPRDLVRYCNRSRKRVKCHGTGTPCCGDWVCCRYQSPAWLVCR